MPWQRQVAYVMGELVRHEELGIWVPAYPEVIVTLPRQNGKTNLVLTSALDRALAWEAWDGKPQGLAYSAQNGSEARKKFRKEHMPLVKRSALDRYVSKYRLAAEDTGMDFSNDSVYTIWNNSEDSGHGGTIDWAAVDELWGDEDDRREQAVGPAMSTRHDRQKLITSTKGTEKSVVLDRKILNGKRAVDGGVNQGIAFFEWSADDDADPEDPATWASCNPALGHTILSRTLGQRLEEMRGEDGDLSEFKRAHLNVPVSASGEQVIPPHVWESITDPDYTTSGPLVLAADGDPDNTWGSVAVADDTGTSMVVAHDRGQSWMTAWLVKTAREKNCPVVVDMTGPVRGLSARLKAEGVRVVEYSRQDYATACAEFLTQCLEGGVRVRSDDVLTAAVQAARKQPQGDLWTWRRKNTLSVISPLVAVTLAIHAASSVTNEPDPGLVFAVLD